LKDAVYSTEMELFNDTDTKFLGLAQPSRQQLLWPLVGAFLIAVDCYTLLTVVALKKRTTSTNSINVNAESWGLISLTEYVYTSFWDILYNYFM
jgi:hypothetical protein